MAEHKLKTLAPYWDAVDRGEKLFEVRRDDRGFQKGDVLVLEKYDGAYYIHTGADSFSPICTIRATVLYVLTGGQLGIEPGYVVMGIAKQPPEASHGK